MRIEQIRIESVAIEGLKNVLHGEIQIDDPYSGEIGPSVLGLYGQNGSGKTTLVSALTILKLCLSGASIADFGGWVNIGSKQAKLTYGLRMVADSVDADYGFDLIEIGYEVNLRVKKQDKKASSDDSGDIKEHKRVEDDAEKLFIESEVIRIGLKSGDRIIRQKRVTIDTGKGAVFGPDAGYKRMVGTNEEARVNLLVEKRMAYRESKSFIFSDELAKAITAYLKGNEEAEAEAQANLAILTLLKRFGNLGIFILSTEHMGAVSFAEIPIPFRIKHGDNSVSFGTASLPLLEPELFDEYQYNVLKQIEANINIVLPQLVPGLTIEVKKVGERLTESGEMGTLALTYSNRAGDVIPLEYESNGIKRVVSFLMLLILMYNDSTVTVVIDEFDAGVFEYLLGELTKIMSQHGKGQLIFTSHNLRPLETIDKKYIAFTTTNPKDRYIRLDYVKPTNNLRRFYYHDLQLGGQDEELYDQTNNARIALALKRAGRANES